MIELAKTIRLHLDTEFTNFVNPELISIGLAGPQGIEFYGENLDFNRNSSSEYVKKVIYPLLEPDKFGKKEIELSARLWHWLDEVDADFLIVSADYQTDFDLFFDLLGEKHPKILEVENLWLTINRWINGTIVNDSNPDESARVMHNTIRKKFNDYFLQYFLINKKQQHHALSDARAINYAYQILVQEFAIPN